MSLAKSAAKGISKRVLILDVERARGWASVPFWDLGSYKNRRIPPSYVTQWPRTIMVAAKWLGNRRVMCQSEWDYKDGKGHLVWAHDLYSEADIVVGHNLDKADTRWLQTEWHQLGLGRPRPFKTVDTYKVARTQLGMESNTLDALCQRLGLAGKTDRYDPELAERALEGNRSDQRKLARYCKGDITATEGLYLNFRGLMTSHPPLSNDPKTLRCNQCNSDDLERQPNDYLANILAYPLHQCRNCGAWITETRQSTRTANVRGAR